jgi:hypothetical protein
MIVAVTPVALAQKAGCLPLTTWLTHRARCARCKRKSSLLLSRSQELPEDKPKSTYRGEGHAELR